ncbi:MAG: FlgD immunoglobulin-like domain containing protein [bacterium]
MSASRRFVCSTFVRAWARRLAVASVLLALSQAAAAAFEIGHRSITFADPTRGNRSVLTEVYYPATIAGDNVPVAGGGSEQFPVVVFGHGYVMPYSAYQNVWEALAPVGFIVALPRTESGLFPNHGQFAQDLAFLADTLRSAGTDPGSPFFGSVAASAAVMGHSMGGGASILAAAGNSRVQAVANFAAAETNPSAITAAAGVTAAALLFAGSLDCVTPPLQHQIPIYDALDSSCRALVTITGASHCQFAGPNSACTLGETGCASPTITRAQQHALADTLLVPWLAYVLRGDGDAGARFRDLVETLGGIAAESSCDATGVEIASQAGDRALDLAAWPDPSVAGRAGPSGSAGDGVQLAFTLARAGRARLELYDTSGRRVRAVIDASLPPGRHTFTWDGRDDRGQPPTSGVYFALLRTQEGDARRTLHLVR